MGHIMRKPVFVICEQQRLRSACASTQSDKQCKIQQVCEVGLEFAAWDLILRVPRIRVKVGVLR